MVAIFVLPQLQLNHLAVVKRLSRDQESLDRAVKSQKSKVKKSEQSDRNYL
jgi:hypothetical protein